MLWAAVAERLHLPVVSQAAALSLEGAGVHVKRQTEFGYDVIEAPLPAVVAVSDAINEPRYPSLKGIMGAKKKPQEILSLADLGVDAADAGEAGSQTTVLALALAAGARRLAEDRGRRQRRAGDRRLPRGEEAHLMATLVFLEHHGDELQKGSLGVLAKAAALGGDVAAVLVGGGVTALAAEAGSYGATKVLVADDASLEPPLPQPRVDVLAKIVRDGGYDTVLFANSVLAADIAAGLAARLDAGINWDLADLVQQDGELVGKRPALAGLRLRRRRLEVGAAHRALPRRLVRRGADRRRRAADGERRG